MKHYYIVRHDDPENILTGKDIEIHFDRFEDAEEWANAHGIESIEEIGGNWDVYKKCWFCEEWFPASELNEKGNCARCVRAITYHNGGY